MRLLLSRKLPVVKWFCFTAKTVHMLPFSLSVFHDPRQISWRDRGKWEGQNRQITDNLSLKSQGWQVTCVVNLKSFFSWGAGSACSQHAAWVRVQGCQLEGASFPFSSPMLLIQQPLGIHIGVSGRHSTREQPMKNNLHLAPQIPKVLKLSSGAFPAHFIVMLVCVEFWWMYLLTFSGKQPAAMNTINDTVHFGKSIIRKPAAISGTLVIPIIHTQAIWLIVPWILTSPGVMAGQCWPSHELRAVRGNHLYRATVSTSGQKCPISGGLGQAPEIYLPPGMEDLETLLVTSAPHWYGPAPPESILQLKS